LAIKTSTFADGGKIAALVVSSTVAMLLSGIDGMSAQARPTATIATANLEAMTLQPSEVGGIYTESDPTDVTVGYTAKMDDPAALTGTGTLQYTVDNASGQVINQGQVAASAALGNAAVAQFDFRISGYGYYSVTTTIQNSAGAIVAKAGPAGFALVPDPAPASGSTTAGPLGMNGNFSAANAGVPLADVYTMLQDQGINWYRVTLNPGAIFAEGLNRPNYRVDNLGVKTAEAQGIQLVGVLSGWPHGMNPFVSNSGVTFQTALDTYVTDVQAIVQHYRPGGQVATHNHWKTYGISTWEIWNEPTNPAFWGGDAESYANLAQTTAEAIRAIEPNATILVYDDGTNWLAAATDTNLYSGLSLHYYPGAPGPLNPNDNLNTVVENGLADAKTLDVNLWITETGWSTREVTPVQQAEHWVDTALGALADGPSHLFLFTQIYPGSGFSEEHPNLTPKMAYPALAALTNRTAGYQPAGTLNTESSIQADAWTDGNQTEVALWTTEPNVAITLPTNTLPFQAYDWMDNPISTSGADVTLPLSLKPVYLVFPTNTPTEVQTFLNAPLASGTPTAAPFTVSMHSLRLLNPDTLEVAVSIENDSSTPVGGTLSLTLPSGWTGEPFGDSASANPSVSIPAVPEGAGYEEVFVFNAPEAISAPFPVTATLSNPSGLNVGQTQLIHLPGT